MCSFTFNLAIQCRITYNAQATKTKLQRRHLPAASRSLLIINKALAHCRWIHASLGGGGGGGDDDDRLQSSSISLGALLAIDRRSSPRSRQELGVRACREDFSVVDARVWSNRREEPSHSAPADHGATKGQSAVSARVDVATSNHVFVNNRVLAKLEHRKVKHENGVDQCRQRDACALHPQIQVVPHRGLQQKRKEHPGALARCHQHGIVPHTARDNVAAPPRRRVDQCMQRTHCEHEHQNCWSDKHDPEVAVHGGGCEAASKDGRPKVVAVLKEYLHDDLVHWNERAKVQPEQERCQPHGTANVLRSLGVALNGNDLGVRCRPESHRTLAHNIAPYIGTKANGCIGLERAIGADHRLEANLTPSAQVNGMGHTPAAILRHRLVHHEKAVARKSTLRKVVEVSTRRSDLQRPNQIDAPAKIGSVRAQPPEAQLCLVKPLHQQNERDLLLVVDDKLAELAPDGRCVGARAYSPEQRPLGQDAQDGRNDATNEVGHDPEEQRRVSKVLRVAHGVP
eukprot:m.42285 g.42285  ORF g.42285 m.42285 type:complete len:513 (-) comp6082_c0_seq2:3211-4749(-)